jgi:hypothetical protein
MTAYPENELFNGDVRSQAHKAFDASEISKESLHKIEEAYPCKLYTPHFFIAFALGLLTTIALIFAGFLAWLLTSAESSGGIAALCVFMSALCYVLLELMVKSKKYYNAGVDNVLMFFILVFSAGIFLSNFENTSWILFSGMLMLVAAWLCIRFNDAFMAVLSCAFLLIGIFLLILKLGDASLTIVPFVIMAVMALLYLLVNKIQKRVKFIYEKSLAVLTIFLLMSFYAAGNYWVISELQNSITNVPRPVSFGWIFWIFTFLLPVFYIVYGVVKKDLLHIRTGLFLVVITILTYKHYFTLLPLEVEMLLAGILLVGLSYFLIKWLRPSRYGYTSEVNDTNPAWKNIEALVIAETMSGGQTATAHDQLMAGGSGGGGGASGEF